jgi:hypothetical protein
MSTLSDFSESMDARFEAHDTKFDQIDLKLDVIDLKFDQVDEKLDHMNAKIDKLLNILDSSVADTSEDELEMASRDAKSDRHERWINQLAVHAKVQLA